MELKLIVLAGAKQGLEIPLKKDKFLIGRAKECSLRAGSEAISRRHCAIVRKDGSWKVRDLGSRNGTYVNDTRIAEEVALKPGDELRVGPLKFKIATAEKARPAAASPAASSSAAEQPKPRKQPPVKDVADVVQRTISKSDGSTSEDDISRWLLGMNDANGEANLNETLAMQLEETRAHGRIPLVNELPAKDETEEVADETASAEVDDASNDAPTDEAGSGGWSLFKRGKGAPAKKKPGKLPPRPEQQSKDSREAAADILREMTRRR
ncbi:MAG: FHA domain-containing protein [Planctomycetes bacterium]|nr:FHA domain-containing protein [Planctomycetota bacterium]